MAENKESKHVCWPAGINESKIITETQFGHGDSTHICYVKCTICDKESKKFSNYGLFNDLSLRDAQKDWNDNNITK